LFLLASLSGLEFLSSMKNQFLDHIIYLGII
jgi:hypothetical protein